MRMVYKANVGFLLVSVFIAFVYFPINAYSGVETGTTQDKNNDRSNLNYQMERGKAITIKNIDRKIFIDFANCEGKLFGVGEHGLIVQSADDGLTWTQLPSPIDVGFNSIWFTDQGVGWIVGSEKTVVKSSDQGKTWQMVSTDPRSDLSLLDVWFEDNNTGYILGADGYLARTGDAGVHWTEIRLTSKDESFDPLLYSIGKLSDGTLIVAGESASVFRSKDGLTWENISPDYDGTFFGVVVLPGDQILAFGIAGNAYLSQDEGNTWKWFDTGIKKTAFTVVAIDEKYLILGGAGGLVSILPFDAGNIGHVHIIAKRIVSYPITAIAVVGRNLIVASAGGITRIPIEELIRN